MAKREIEKKLKKKGVTKFQLNVLLATYSIPKGKTITYKELAKKAG